MAKRKISTFERLQQGSRLDRRERRELQRRLSSSDPGLQVVHSDAAGIDVGNASHFVSVPSGRDEHPVQEFGSWTADSERLTAWLVSRGIRTVAMQSTGVYWVALYEILEQAGLEVYLVNARGTKNLPGRKSDVQECQWLMKLHTYGLLRNSFRPPKQIRSIRTIWRLRERIVADAGRTVQQMQKALTTMNIQLANAISDISGVTGMAIVRAIVQGQRDPQELAKLRNWRIQASHEEIVHSLNGNWRPDVVWELARVLESYDFCQKQIEACDWELQKCLAVLPDRMAGGQTGGSTEACQAKRGRSTKPRKNQPRFDLRTELRRILGVDLTRIDGIDVIIAQVILSELGPDLSAFPNEAAFASWLELVPRRDITGGKVVRQRARESKNRVANALRMAAESLLRSNSYLGARYRQLRARMEGQAAVKAMAHYLARLVYRLMTKGQEYIDRGAAHFEHKRQQREIANLTRKAAKLGMAVIPRENACTH
jgi:transposase